jgi:hypothetical protein
VSKFILPLKKGVENRDGAIKAPPIVRFVGFERYPDIARELYSKYRPTISGFYMHCHQNHYAGVTNQSFHEWETKDATLRYTNLFDTETIDVELRPEVLEEIFVWEMTEFVLQGSGSGYTIATGQLFDQSCSNANYYAIPLPGNPLPPTYQTILSAYAPTYNSYYPINSSSLSLSGGPDFIPSYKRVYKIADLSISGHNIDYMSMWTTSAYSGGLTPIGNTTAWNAAVASSIFPASDGGSGGAMTLTVIGRQIYEYGTACSGPVQGGSGTQAIALASDSSVIGTIVVSVPLWASVNGYVGRLQASSLQMTSYNWTLSRTGVLNEPSPIGQDIINKFSITASYGAKSFVFIRPRRPGDDPSLPTIVI